MKSLKTISYYKTTSAENKNLWSSLKKIKNLKIDNKTNSNEQIVDAKFVIHFNSTMKCSISNTG